MKKIFFTILLIFTSVSVFSGEKAYLVVFNKLTDVDNARAIIAKTPGLTIQKYCSDRTMFYVMANDTLFTNLESFETNLRPQLQRKIQTKFFFSDKVNHDELLNNSNCQ